MKKCPYCAEEIQDDAIKCKHCGEWLEAKNQTPPAKPLPELSPSENKRIIKEDIKLIKRQISILLIIPELNINDWDTFDLIFSNSRIVLVKAAERSKIDVSGPILIDLLSSAYEKYQQITKDKKIEIGLINDLIKNKLAASMTIDDINRIVVAKHSLPTWKKVLRAGEALSRVGIKGNILFGDSKSEGVFGLYMDNSKKDSKKYFEKYLPVKVTINNKKFEESLPFEDIFNL